MYEINPKFAAIAGRSQKEMTGIDWINITHPDDVQEGLDKMALLNAGKIPEFNINKRYIWPDGSHVWISMKVVPLKERDGTHTRHLSMIEDITDRKKADSSLRLSASVFAHAQENIMITDADHIIVDVNAAFTRDTGYSREEAIGKNPSLLKSGHQGSEFYRDMWQHLENIGYWRGELWNRNKNGEVFAVLLTITAVRNEFGKITHYVGISADITQIKQHQQKLEHSAHHDALTGLPNRMLLADRLRQAIAQSQRNEQLMAVCYLDLDEFKPINDSMGHDAGDLVLIEVATRITATIRGGDTVARLGGDEFVILLLGLEQVDEFRLTLDRLLKAISRPIDIFGKQAQIAASIGVSLFPISSEDPDTLLRQADLAMYTAKQSGRNQYKLYSWEIAN